MSDSKTRDTKPDPEQLRLDRRVSYRFSIIARRQTQCLAAMHMSKCGLSVNGWKLLSVIEYFGPLSGIEAAKFTSLDQTKVTRGIDALAAQGLVHRRQDPADRRRTILTLSAKGRRIHDKVEAVSRALERELLTVLGPQERQGFYLALDKLERRSSQIFARPDAWRDIAQVRVAGDDAALLGAV